MQKGSSEPWQNVLSELTDGRVNYLDPAPLLEYFKPLYEWLLEQSLNSTNTEWHCDRYLDVNHGTVRSYSSSHKKAKNFIRTEETLPKVASFSTMLKFNSFLIVFSHIFVFHQVFCK